MIATFDGEYNATLLAAAEGKPRLLSLAIAFISRFYTFDVLTPEHIRWALTEIRKQKPELAPEARAVEAA